MHSCKSDLVTKYISDATTIILTALWSLQSFNTTLHFLNLPIWANFVDPTDLSLYYLPTLDQPTLFYSLNLNLNQLNKLRTRLDKQSRLSLAY